MRRFFSTTETIMSEKSNSSSGGCSIGGGIYLVVAVSTAMIGYHIHDNWFWACCDFFFWPLAWAKWLVMQQVNLTVIRETFAFFLR